MNALDLLISSIILWNPDITKRVPNRFLGIRDLKAGIRDFSERGDRDSGL